MSTVFDVLALTEVVRIELDDSVSTSMAEMVCRQWADARVYPTSRPAVTLRYGVWHGQNELSQGDRLRAYLGIEADLPGRIASDTTVAALRGMSGEALLFHACGVALDDGSVIGFVGPSGTGKTTAAQRLGEEYGYVTDEALAIRLDGSVVRFVKPLSIGRHPQRKTQHAASSLGLRLAPEKGLTLAALVLLDRRDDVDAPFVEAVPLRDALPELMHHTSFLASVKDPLRSLSEVLLRTGGVRRVVYRDATALPDFVTEILATRDLNPPALTDHSRLRQGAEVPAKALPSGSHRRADHVDSIAIDNEVFIFREGEIVRLSDIGASVWLAADDANHVALKAAVLDALEEPSPEIDPAQAVARVLQELIDAGLLVRG